MNFSYKVRDQQGLLIEGELEGESEVSVVNSLLGQNYYIIFLQENEVRSREINLDLSRGRVPGRDLVALTRQWAAMILSGVTVFRSLTILEQQTANKNLKKALKEVRQDVEKGGPVWQALQRHPRIFSSVFVSMVHAGESSGTLDKVLARLSLYLEREQEIKSKITSASAYPIAISIFTMLAVTFIITFIMPGFLKMFDATGAGLPLPTKILLGLSDAIKAYGLYILVGIIISGLCLRRWRQTKAGRYFVDRLYLRIPLLGPNLSRLITARFISTLGTLTQAGVSVIQALSVTEEVVDNAVMTGAINRASTSINEGEPVSVPLQEAKIFDPIVIQMIAVGEETGELGNMLVHMADYLEKETLYYVDMLMSLLEPILIIIVALVIGGIVLAVLLPAFELMGTIG